MIQTIAKRVQTNAGKVFFCSVGSRLSSLNGQCFSRKMTSSLRVAAFTGTCWLLGNKQASCHRPQAPPPWPGCFATTTNKTDEHASSWDVESTESTVLKIVAVIFCAPISRSIDRSTGRRLLLGRSQPTKQSDDRILFYCIGSYASSLEVSKVKTTTSATYLQKNSIKYK